MDLNASDWSHLSFTSIDLSFACNTTSTPKTNPRGKKKSVLNTLSRKNPVKTPTAICAECGKKYVSLKAYQKHMRLHSIEKSSCHHPSEEEILNNVPLIDSETLDKCLTSIAHGKTGEEYLELVTAVKHASEDSDSWAAFRLHVFNHLIPACTKSGQFILPSELIRELTNSAEILLTCANSREHQEALLKCIMPSCNSDRIHNFICNYVLQCIHGIIKFVSLSVRKDYLGTTSKIINLDQEDEEVIFYCAGSILNGFIRMGRRHSRNAFWQRTVKCIQSKLLESDDTCDAPLYQKRWTESIDRGALKKVNAKTMKFFICVAKCCAQCEEADGSLPYDLVLQNVLKNGIAATWDEIIGDSLPHRESLSVMYGIIKSFSRTCSHGIARRRINKETGNKAKPSLTLRHQVAPK